MGLISEILLLPIAPVRGTVAVAELILQEAEDTYYDPAVIREQLEQVDTDRQNGELTEDEAAAWEDELISRLAEGQRR